METIFSGVDPLLNFHKDFLANLRAAEHLEEANIQQENAEETTGEKKKLSMGEVFLEMGDGLLIYTQYVNNYNKAIAELRKTLSEIPVRCT